MATNFPGSLDNGTSLPYPGALNSRNSPSLAGVQVNQNDSIIAIETKLGTGSSTPTSGKLLLGTGAGTSSWSGTAPASGLFVGTTDTQTLTNKTLTSPTINTPNITNATISADALTGFSAANTGTVYGVSVASAKINGSSLTNLSVGNAQIASSAVTYDKLFNPYAFAAYMSATQSTVLNTFTKLNFNTVIFDPNSNFNTTTRGYTVPVNGYYSFTIMAQLLAQAAQPWIISFSKDGTTEWVRGQEIPNTTGNITITATHTFKLAAGEIIYPMYYSGTASKTINSGLNLSRFSGILLYPY